MTEPAADAGHSPDARIDEDAILLRRWCEGDARALETLAQRHEIALLGLCKGMLGGRRDLAAEVVQEVWLRVIRSAVGFRGDSSVKTWLYTIAINQCRSLLRKAEMRHPHGQLDDRADVRAGAVNGPPENGQRAPEVSDQLADAVAALAPDQRELISLCYHAQLTHTEVAQTLGLPVGTVKSRLHAALLKLRGHLAQAEVRS